MTERIEYFPGDTVRIGEKEFVLPERSQWGNFRINTGEHKGSRRATFNEFGELSGHNELGSLFTLVKRAPRKVTKTIERWAPVLPNGAIYIYESEQDAKAFWPNQKTYFKLTGTYEEEMDKELNKPTRE